MWGLYFYSYSFLRKTLIIVTPYDITFHIPHAITIVEDTEKFDVKKYGEELEVDKTFI